MPTDFLAEMAAEAARVRGSSAPDKIRVVVFDTFKFPAEATILAEVDANDLGAAIALAKGHVGKFSDACVYDHGGNCLWPK